METYQNQNFWPLTTVNDQTNATLDIASNYGPYPYVFGGSTFNWNGIVPHPMAYGRHVSYWNTHQQQQPEFGFYSSMPSPASSTTTVSPTKQLENEICSNIEYMVPTPFHSPPIEQIDTYSSKTFPSEPTHSVMQNQYVLPYSYHVIDERNLQSVLGNLETAVDTSHHVQANPTTVSLDVSDWRCEPCNKQFASKVGLKQHNKIIHTDERLFRCEKCGKRFKELVLLQRHILRHATNNKPYRCENCPKTFNHRADLRRHQYYHTGDAPHQCSICSKPFARRDHMRSHELTHRKRPVVSKELG